MVEKGRYKTIKIPKTVVEKVDTYLKEHPEYISRLELIKEAIRMHIKDDKK